MHRYDISHHKRGQILMFVLFLLFLIGFIGTGLAVVWQTDSNLRTLERDGLTAFYAAQAGIEYGELYAIDNPLYYSSTQWFPCNDDTDNSCWYTLDASGARYKFNIYRSGTDRYVWAKGQAYNGKVLAEKHVELNISRAEGWRER
jgi:Tfp pilus assembly protein PilX